MSVQEAAKQIRVGLFAQGNKQGHEHKGGNGIPHNAVAPSPSQAETLMSTQEANERTELRLAEKGKAVDAPPTANQSQPSIRPPAKQPLNQSIQPAKSPLINNPVSAQDGLLAAGMSSNVTPPQLPGALAPTPAAPTTLASTNALPVKRGPGRPRKSGVHTGPPLAKRPRGRPRNVTTPAGLGRQRDEQTSEADSEPHNIDDSGDSDYHGSDDGSSSTVPPNILAQFNAHVTLLRSRLDQRGIPEQYSVFKSFWVPTRASYFDGGATAPPGRFVYWDPLFITSVACPVCQQPLAIAAGGGWLDAPLGIRDEDGPCWIIGRRYVCTQCFAATEEAARYVQGEAGPTGASNPSSSGATGDGKSSPTKIDFSSPVYYLSWEKRFRSLLPLALATEFPKRAAKRAAFTRATAGIAASGGVDMDLDMGVEGEEEETPKRSRRVRHCMKCGSKSCAGRLSRSRCPNPCHDCGLSSCGGRIKPNVTCKGESGSTFRELSPEASSPIESRASRTPAPPQSLSWPAALPNIPPGCVLAIPYPVGADGKPTGAQPAMAYLVPQAEVPGFPAAPANSQMGASSRVATNGVEASDPAVSAPISAPAPVSATAPGATSNPQLAPIPASAPGLTQATQAVPVTGVSLLAPQQERLQVKGNDTQSKASAHPKPTSKQKTQPPQQKVPAPAQTQAQTAQAPVPQVPAPAPGSIAPQSAPQAHPHTPHPPQPANLAAHPHPPPPLPNHAPPYPQQHGAPYPPPPHGASPDSGFYGAFYSYGYLPSYAYGYYPPYPQGPTPNSTPGVATTENGAALAPGHPMPSGYPQYASYPPPGYPMPAPGSAYPPAGNAYVAPPPAPGSASTPVPANGYSAAPQGAPGQLQPQPVQYMPYQPPDPNRPTATSGPTARKRKATGPGEKPTDAKSQG